ncbi:hypothetical protein DRN74_04970 [Candidatus Micrarchaeota archaeon]|nr:MAG: hypothetical protein DRN74_04970 [Candidatus Micrarchaeota archaeon]
MKKAVRKKKTTLRINNEELYAEIISLQEKANFMSENIASITKHLRLIEKRLDENKKLLYAQLIILLSIISFIVGVVIRHFIG